LIYLHKDNQLLKNNYRYKNFDNNSICQNKNYMELIYNET